MKISSVVKDNLCVSCGICAGVCPKNCISSVFKAGSYLPAIDENSCVNCGLCHKVCPGKSSDYSGSLEDIFFGQAIKCFIAQTRCEEVLAQATSGGGVTTLVGNLLKQKIYDAAFLVDTYNHDKEIFTNRYTAESNFISTPKSRYLTVNHSRAVKYMLANRDAKIILVGTPCFVQGILNVIDQFKLRRENYLLLGLFCDKTMNYNVWKYFKAFGAEKVYFRTKEPRGWPGDVGLEIGGKKFFMPREVRMRMKDFFCLERCLYCLDKLNRGADISFGDNYSDTPLPAQMNRNAGTSNIIIRTPRGAEIFKRYLNKFNLREIPAAAIAKAQHLNNRLKNFIFSEYKSAEVGYAINNLPPEISCRLYENTDTRREYESLLTKQKIGREKFFPEVAANIW